MVQVNKDNFFIYTLLLLMASLTKLESIFFGTEHGNDDNHCKELKITLASVHVHDQRM